MHSCDWVGGSGLCYILGRTSCNSGARPGRDEKDDLGQNSFHGIVTGTIKNIDNISNI